MRGTGLTRHTAKRGQFKGHQGPKTSANVRAERGVEMEKTEWCTQLAPARAREPCRSVGASAGRGLSEQDPTLQESAPH